MQHKEIISQLENENTYKINWDNISKAIFLFSIGLAKKVLIADTLSPFVQTYFSSPSTLDTPTAWFAALAFTMQLYFDFSGYSDMAIGLGLFFNINIPWNFNSPYKARSIIDFWKRWHITLSRFLRDYLYIPLGGNRKGKPRKYINLMITMCLGGLWHGAGWTYIIWGILHGFYVACNHLINDLFESKKDNIIKILLGRFVTFILVVIGWVFF